MELNKGAAAGFRRRRTKLTYRRLARWARRSHTPGGELAERERASTPTLPRMEDRLPGGDPIYLPAAERALYVVDGDLTVETSTGCSHQAAGSAWLGDAALGIVPGSGGATILRWELLRAADRDTGILRSAPHCASAGKPTTSIDLDPGFGWLMRCDRVTFPKGGIAYTHIHQGPGIRYCLEGRIRIETEGQVHSYGPGQAWFEIGSAPVRAPTSEDTETSFGRCFALPRARNGRGSIRYVFPDAPPNPHTPPYPVPAEP